MATQKQIDANRRNALKSTGPRTAAGKAIVALNSLRHGLRAETLILPGENRCDFTQLRAGLEAEWSPQTPAEQLCLQQMATAQWRLARLESADAEILKTANTAADHVPLIDRLSKCQCRLERAFSQSAARTAAFPNLPRLTRK